MSFCKKKLKSYSKSKTSERASFSSQPSKLKNFKRASELREQQACKQVSKCKQAKQAKQATQASKHASKQANNQASSQLTNQPTSPPPAAYDFPRILVIQGGRKEGRKESKKVL